MDRTLKLTMMIDDESKLLVLGITFEVSDCDSTTPLVQGVLEKALTIPNFGDKTQSGELDFSQVVEHVKKVDTFRYAGSLTTPPCSEGVTWLVSSEPLPIDVKSYLAAKRVMKYNSRYTQNDPGQINLLEYAAESLSNKV
jgi:carbonic anhydrase